MARLADESLGSVVSLWRYPVKSMMGEELNAAQISDRGLLGDRAYALVDSSDGKVASAKNPRKWPRLFDFRAALVETPQPGAAMPPVRITLPDGTTVTSDEADLHKSLVNVLGREVTLEAAELGERDKVEPSSRAPWASRAEEYWPDIDGLDYQDTVTDFDLPAGTFFDCAVIHLLTTATI